MTPISQWTKFTNCKCLSCCFEPLICIEAIILPFDFLRKQQLNIFFQFSDISRVCCSLDHYSGYLFQYGLLFCNSCQFFSFFFFFNLVPVNLLQTFSEVAFGTGFFFFFFYYNLQLSHLSHLFYVTVMRVLKRESIFAVFQKCLLCCILFSNTLCTVPLISKGQMLMVGFSALNFH